MRTDPHTYYRTRSAGRSILIQEVRPAAPGRLGFGVRVRPDGSWWEKTINGSPAVEQVFYTEEDRDEMTPMVLDLDHCEIVRKEATR